MSLVEVDYNCTPAKMVFPAGSPVAHRIYIAFVYRLLVVVLSILNIAANGFSLHIFRQPVWKKSLISILLKGLSTFEILFHINVFLGAVLGLVEMNVNLPSLTAGIVVSYTVKIANLLMLTFQMARNWTVVMLAAYRYEVICRPLCTTKVFTPESMAKVLLLQVAVGLTLSLPRFFEAGVLLCPEIWRKAMSKPIFLTNPWYYYGYIGVIMFLGQSGGPVISVCVLSFFVLRVIYKRRQFRKDQKLQDRCASCAPTGDKLVLTLCATFFVFETPAFFSKILNTPLRMARYNSANLYLGLCGNILIYLDSMINMFVYMGSNPTYREATAGLVKRTCGLDLESWKASHKATTTTTTTTGGTTVSRVERNDKKFAVEELNILRHDCFVDDVDDVEDV